MKKFFVFSDIHGFFNEFIDALGKAGYDQNNSDHWLIGCGDYFDRGNQSKDIMNYLLTSPRTILIKGNHEILMEEMLNRGFPGNHDFHNGTFKTVLDLNNYDESIFYYDYLYSKATLAPLIKKFFSSTKKIIKPFYNNMINYFETENYIFCHSWIPCNTFYTYSSGERYIDNWKELGQDKWEQAMWGNPFENALGNNNKTGKTIVSGHWHTSYYYSKILGIGYEFSPDAIFEIARIPEKKYIGIDACTSYSKKVNILVVEDDFV